MADCSYCCEVVDGADDEESVAVGGSGKMIMHRECLIRSVVGSAAHQLGDCRCNGGRREDPPGKRDPCTAAVFPSFEWGLQDRSNPNLLDLL